MPMWGRCHVDSQGSSAAWLPPGGSLLPAAPHLAHGGGGRLLAGQQRIQNFTQRL